MVLPCRMHRFSIQMTMGYVFHYESSYKMHVTIIIQKLHRTHKSDINKKRNFQNTKKTAILYTRPIKRIQLSHSITIKLFVTAANFMSRVIAGQPISHSEKGPLGRDSDEKTGRDKHRNAEIRNGTPKWDTTRFPRRSTGNSRSGR